jgi:CHASE2 domain-containing sensor protein
MITASEVADYVFCMHSWYLRRQQVPVSNDALSRMTAGVVWQGERDQLVPKAIEQEQQATTAYRLAWAALVALLIVVTAWASYCYLQR